MKKISIKKIIEFRGKSDRTKKTFVQNLKLESESKKSESGGDYWISSLSAISNSYKRNNSQSIKDKVYELEDKFENADYERTKIMYRRNIDILYKYEVFDFKIWKPNEQITYIKKHKSDFVLTIQGLPIEAVPHHVFYFQGDDIKEIGAIWFIAKLDGYREVELGMFTDILYRYLKNIFSTDYILNPRYCIAVDVVNNFAVNYYQIEKGEVPSILDKTIAEIKKIM